MKELTFGLILSISMGLLAAQSTTETSLKIKLSTNATTVVYGTAISLKIELLNHTNHAVNCSSFWGGSGNASYPVEIEDASGWKIQPVDYEDGSKISCTLPAGQSMEWGQSLAPPYYPKLVPGKYSIRISTVNPDDPDNPKANRLYSNTVAIVIQPASAKPD